MNPCNAKLSDEGRKLHTRQIILMLMLEDGVDCLAEFSDALNPVDSRRTNDFAFLEDMEKDEAMRYIIEQLDALVADKEITFSAEKYTITEKGRETKAYLDNRVAMLENWTENVETGIAILVNNDWLAFGDALDFLETLTLYVTKQQRANKEKQQ